MFATTSGIGSSAAIRWNIRIQTNATPFATDNILKISKQKCKQTAEKIYYKKIICLPQQFVSFGPGFFLPLDLPLTIHDDPNTCPMVNVS